MVLNQFPNKEEKRKLSKIADYSFLNRISVFLCLILLVLIGLRAVFSGPEEEGRAGIAGTGTVFETAGLTAWQKDFRYSGSFDENEYGNKRIDQPVVEDNISGAAGASIGGGGLNLSNAAAGDVKLPFNIFFPGRGQGDGNTGFKLVGAEINPDRQKLTWKFNSSGKLSYVGDAANVPSIQKVNPEVLDAVLGLVPIDPYDPSKDITHRAAGQSGVVFTNDVYPFPKIIVASYKYDNTGNALIQRTREFDLNSSSYWTGVQSKPRIIVDSNIWEYRPNPTGAHPLYCNPVQYHHPDEYHDHYYSFALDPTAIPPENIEQAYEGSGLIHDTHLVVNSKDTNGNITDYRFIITILNYGVFELKPTATTGSNLTCTWKYTMPTYTKVYRMEDNGQIDPLQTCSMDGHTIRVHRWACMPQAGMSWFPEKPTTWYAQPTDNGDGLFNNSDNLLIGVGPWKSYWDNGNMSDDTSLYYMQQQIQLYNGSGDTIYNPGGYPPSNNTVVGDKAIGWTGVKVVNRGSSAVTQENALANGQPKWSNNLGEVFLGINDSKIWTNNSNLMLVGDVGTTTCGSVDPWNPNEKCTPPEIPSPPTPRLCPQPCPPLGPGDKLDSDTKFYGPRISRFESTTSASSWNYNTILNSSKPAGMPNESGYSETLFQLPNPDYFFVNIYNWRANTYQLSNPQYSGIPAILSATGAPGNGQTSLIWEYNGGDPKLGKYNYVHMGAGSYAAYGTKRGDLDSRILDRNIETEKNYISSQRDGGLHSKINQYIEPYKVRDFNGFRSKAEVTKPKPDQDAWKGQTAMAYSLANEDGKIFKNIEMASGFTDLRTLVTEDGKVNGKNDDLSKYQNINLVALMWGDISAVSLDRFQNSLTPILQAWGIGYTDRSAQFTGNFLGQGGHGENAKDPYLGNYIPDGYTQFYTNKGDETARFKFSVTNKDNENSANPEDQNNTSWPAEKLKLTTKEKDDPDIKNKKLNFINGTNKAYYRLTQKGGGAGTPGTLKITANGSADQWTDPPTYLGCYILGDCQNIGGYHSGGSCGSADYGCKYSCDGANKYWGKDCGDNDLGCQYSCSGSHYFWGANCYSSYVGCIPTGNCSGDHKYCGGVCGGSGYCACYKYLGQHCMYDKGIHCMETKKSCYKAGASHTVWPIMKVYANGTLVGTQTVNTINPTTYSFNYNMTENDAISVVFDNDSSHPPNDCNLYIGTIELGDGTVKYPETDGRIYTRKSNGMQFTYGPSWDGQIMKWNGTIAWPSSSSLPYYPIPDANLSYSGGIGGTLTINLPAELNITAAKKTTTINPGDKIEIIWTENIINAGKISKEAGLAFYNRGNGIIADPYGSPPCESSVSPKINCTGNAPFISSSFGDVYLGCDSGSCLVHPYYAYNNATFLIQSNGTLGNFKSNKTGWRQENYPLADDLKLSEGTRNMAERMNGEIERLRNNGNIEYIDGNGVLSLNNLPTNKAGILYNGNLEITGGTMKRNIGSKVIAVTKGHSIIITGDMFYGVSLSDPVNNINKLASLGVAIPEGNLYIRSNVTDIIGAYFVNGTINTCFEGSPTDCDKQLRCSGLMAAKKFELMRTWVGADIDPAEKIVYDGRVVLNPPPGFSDLRILPVWKEVAP